MKRLFYCILVMCMLLSMSACNSTQTPDENSTAPHDATESASAPASETPVSETPISETPSAAPVESETPQTVTAPGAGMEFNDPEAPYFSHVSVHDPSIFLDEDGTYYIIGSHMASAKTTDLMAWQQISTGPAKGNPLVPDAAKDFEEALSYAKTTTFWAGDVQLMPDGRYYMYYCTCEGSSPLSTLGLAIADNPEGPYINQGIFLTSGSGGGYNANVHPNAIDPHAFFDKNGDFWMVYGSYSGGIYILRMNPETGLPLEDQGYGTKLLGGNHARIEGPYILYNADTDYYYLFLSYGGLDSTGGYNIRVCRSRNPDGPYEDAQGQDMIDCKGKQGTFFHDPSIAPYGTKLMGGYQFKHLDGEPGRTTGVLSPGHNSAYYDPDTGRYFLIFHQRFTSGSGHSVRVHEMFFNDAGWPVVAPFAYDGSDSRVFTADALSGSYKIINHEQDINSTAKISVTAHLNADGTITGGFSGTWSLGADGVTAALTMDDVSYTGRFLRCWDNDNSTWVMAFTALSADGLALWGAGASVQ